MANGVVSILSSSLKICNRLLPHLRAQLHLPRLVSQNAKVKSKKTPLVDHLSKIIRAHGPITVAQYMRECLTNPEHVRNHKLSQALHYYHLNHWISCLSSRATTCITMCLEPKEILSHPQKYHKCLVRCVFSFL